MVDAMSSMSVQALQKSLEDALRQLLASGSPAIQEQIAPTLSAVLPQASGNEVSELSRLQGGIVLSSLRSKCMQLAQEAAAAQQPAMQYTLRGAAEPAIPRLMQVAICCQQRKLIDASQVLQIMDELQDLLVVEHCKDIITWLEQHRELLSSPAYKTGLQQLIRVCNSIHKRLGKHDVIHRARLLMLIANCTPLFDRSGVNVQAAFAPADPPPVEEVPADAVDSAGKPVDSTLYTAFWKLQPLIQDATKVLKSPSEWDSLQSNLDIVLTGLAKSPATVAAVHAVGSSELAAATAAAAAAAGDGSNGSSALYLSSYKLFGLQLADSAFRRGFLVQVLILLRTLLLPGKQPTDTLKDKSRMQAVALEGRVYKLLEATPKDGKEFAKAVREVLRRETSWVEWKKGKNLALKGTPQAAAPAAGAAGKPQPAQGCNPWDIAPLSSLSAAVGAKQQEADKKSRKRQKDIEDGLQMRQEIADMSKKYDWGGAPFEDRRREKTDMVNFLGGAQQSALTYWCQQQISDGTAMQPQPLMPTLKVSQQEKYPTLERVCTQLIREMDPAQECAPEFKRVTTDPVFRWRISRAVATEAPQYTGSLITAEGLEEGMMDDAMPASVRSNISQQYQDAYKAKKEAEKKAKGAGQKQKSGAAKAAPAGSTLTLGTADTSAAGAEDAAAAGAAAAAAGDEAAGAAVKQEPGQDGAAGAEDADMTGADTAAAAAGVVKVEVKQEDEETAEAAAAAAAAVAAAEAELEAAAAAVGDAADEGDAELDLAKLEEETRAAGMDMDG